MRASLAAWVGAAPGFGRRIFAYPHTVQHISEGRAELSVRPGPVFFRRRPSSNTAPHEHHRYFATIAAANLNWLKSITTNNSQRSWRAIAKHRGAPSVLR